MDLGMGDELGCLLEAADEELEEIQRNTQQAYALCKAGRRIE